MVRRSRANGFLKDFQEFALKGNVVDLAVAVIIGGAFGKIVSSFVENIVMPLVSLAIPGGEWRTAKIILGTKTGADGKIVENALLLGTFFGTIVDFVIIALVIFGAIQAIQKFKKKAEVEELNTEPVTDPAVVAQERLISSLEKLTEAVEAKSV